MPSYPTIDDCVDRLGVEPSDAAQLASLQASLDGQTELVRKARPDLPDPPGTDALDADDYLGILILACLDYRASNSPSGFAGYDGGFGGSDNAERFRAQQLLRIDRYVPPRVG